MQNWEHHAKLYKIIVMCSASAHMCGTFLWHCTTMAELTHLPTSARRQHLLGDNEAGQKVIHYWKSYNVKQAIDLMLDYW